MNANVKITATIQQVQEMTGLGRTTIYKLIDEGRLKTILIGSRRLVVVRSLRRLLEGGDDAAA
jgi:excisionase family DNA binding protein